MMIWQRTNDTYKLDADYLEIRYVQVHINRKVNAVTFMYLGFGLQAVSYHWLSLVKFSMETISMAE